jgi:hypothetical protein
MIHQLSNVASAIYERLKNRKSLLLGFSRSQFVVNGTKEWVFPLSTASAEVIQIQSPHHDTTNPLAFHKINLNQN